MKYLTLSLMKMHSTEFFFVKFLRDNFENCLEISGKALGFYVLKDVVTLDGHLILSNPSLNILCLGKYLSKSFETLC